MRGRSAASGKERRRYTGYNTKAADLACYCPLRRQAGDPDRDIETFIDQVDHSVTGIKSEFDHRIALVEGIDQFRQMHRREYIGAVTFRMPRGAIWN